MDAQAVDLDPVLADLVQAPLEGSPVVVGAPVLHQCDQVGERDTLVPAVVAGWFGLGEPGGEKAGAQIVELSLRHPGDEGLHVSPPARRRRRRGWPRRRG